VFFLSNFVPTGAKFCGMTRHISALQQLPHHHAQQTFTAPTASPESTSSGNSNAQAGQMRAARGSVAAPRLRLFDDRALPGGSCNSSGLCTLCFSILTSFSDSASFSFRPSNSASSSRPRGPISETSRLLSAARGAPSRASPRSFAFTSSNFSPSAAVDTPPTPAPPAETAASSSPLLLRAFAL
jgi:hypothetical protein